MSHMKDIISQIVELTIEDEDGDEIGIELEEPVSAEELEILKEQIPLNQELVDFLSLTNGMDLFSAELYDTDSLSYESGVIVFHNWGNGDFSCIATKHSDFPEGSVLFMNHSPDILVLVASSLGEWLLKVTEEYQEKGTLMHPSDYRFRQESGVYSHVIEALRDRDCELNG